MEIYAAKFQIISQRMPQTFSLLISRTMKSMPSAQLWKKWRLWVLNGDRGITYAKRTPENSTLSQGEWWPEDYSGKPLVSVAEEEAGELGLSIGDQITVNVLGRNISAEVANFRDVQWETLGINFVFVFSPSQLSTAIRAAASIALISSILVLAGALAAGNRERVHDAVVLKTLGATRPTLIKMLVMEYALLGLATAIFAILSGSLAASNWDLENIRAKSCSYPS